MNDNGSDRLDAIEAALSAVERAVDNAIALLGEGFQRQAETTARGFEALTELSRLLDARMSALDARMTVLDARMVEIVHELRTHSHKAA